MVSLKGSMQRILRVNKRIAQLLYCLLSREKNKRLTKVLGHSLISFILISFLADSTCLAYMVNSRERLQ